MTRSTTSFRQRVLAGTGVLTLGVVGTLGTAGFAHAADFDPSGTINTSATGALTIVKRAASGANTAGTLDGTTPGTGTPLAGAKFTIYEVGGTDLTTAEGWKKADQLAKASDLATACATPTAPAMNGFTFTKKQETSATAEGTGATNKIDNLPLRAYLVCETKLPTGALKAAAPFVVTLPQPFEKAGQKGWLYDVTAYPKNVVTTAPTKDQTFLDNTSLGITDNVSFTIKALVPALSATEYFEYFSIVDPMVAQLTGIKITDVTLDNGAGGDAVQINDTTHYTKVIDENKHWAQVNFTKDGLAILKANPGKTVTVKLTATLSSLPTDGKISNTGYLSTNTVTPPTNEQPDPKNPPITPPDTPGQPPKTTDPNTPPPVSTENEVVSSWGSFKFTKVNAGDNTQTLAGAQFKVYASTQTGQTCDANDKSVNGAALTFKDGQVLTTDNQGVLTIPGLLIDQKSVTKGQDPGLKTARCFVVEEVTAPLGYTLPAGDAAKTVITVTPGTTADAAAVKVTNTKQGVPALPITGASGQVLLTVGGVALLFFAIGGYLVNRRRAAQK